MKYEVLIIEDEKHQQDRLVELLRGYPDFAVTGIASTVEDGLHLLNKLEPDLVFLDVLLPPHTSFDLLNRLPEIRFAIIFTTSFEEFAVKAFRLSAVDYLLKPLVGSELATALEKFKEIDSARRASTHIKVLLENIGATNDANRKIALPTLTGFIFVDIRDIIRCESDNTYTTFFLLDRRKIVVSKTLKECEQLLTEHRFVRVHNSHLVNLKYIVEYVRGEGGVVKMSDGSTIDVSRRRKDDFLRQLKKV